MHYVSQQGIVIYVLQYTVACVVGGVIIVVAASTTILGLFSIPRRCGQTSGSKISLRNAFSNSGVWFVLDCHCRRIR